MIAKTLFFGYGNPDRGDDGAAWHILNQLFIEAGKTDADLFTSEVISLNQNIDVWFNLQLLPEFAEMAGAYQQVVFIDAHTGEIKEDLSFHELLPAYMTSPFTHHMAPSTLLSIIQSISGKCPRSWLLSVRGYEFKFDCNLSHRTAELCKQARQKLKDNFLL